MQNKASFFRQIQSLIVSRDYDQCLALLDYIKQKDEHYYNIMKLNLTYSLVLRFARKSDHTIQQNCFQPLLANIDNVNAKIKNSKNNQTDADKGVFGDINRINSKQELVGWIAKKNFANPVSGYLQIGEELIEIIGIDYREDLKKNGINNGKHGFCCKLPRKYFNKVSRTVKLLSFEKKNILAEKSFFFDNFSDRKFHNFQSFLQMSMVEPKIEAPFVEADKRIFATMEELSNFLERKALNLSDMPLVTVIMPVYNREKIVQRAISSVIQQSYQNYELIIIDDSSDDNTLRIISQYENDKIKIISLSKNCGVSNARNVGLEHSQGEYIAYLDSDNVWDPRFIATNIGAFSEIKDAEFLYSGCFLYSGNDFNPSGYRYGHFNKSLLENRNYIDNNTIFHKKSCLERLSGYDTNLKRFVDWDFALRASESTNMYSIPIILCHYYYDSADNTITKNNDLINHGKDVIKKKEARINKLLSINSGLKLTRSVSVIIPSWEALLDLQDCVNSLLNLSIFINLEVIIVDNNSSEKVVEYLQKISRSYKNISVIYLNQNYGYTLAVNKGIEASNRSNDILLLNNDAYVHEGAIQHLQFNCSDDFQMTVPMQILPARTKTIADHVPGADVSNQCDVNISAHHLNVINVPLYSPGDNFELNYAPFFAVYLKRELIDEAGFLNARTGRHYRSDRIFCDKIRLLYKKNIRYVYSSRILHKLQSSTESLKRTDKEQFDIMFSRNQWDPAMAKELNYEPLHWDT